MSKHLEKDVNQVRNRILDLGEMVADSIETASAMIQNYDLVLVNQVYEVEHLIDTIEVEIEEECLKVLALHQPVSENLRFLIVVLKVNNDLERMGDQLKNIAERIEYISDKDRVVADLNLHSMAELCSKMVKESIVALTQQDAKRARTVLKLDDELDIMHAATYKTLIKVMLEKSESIRAALSLLTVSSNLERIGDLATNIAEEIISMEEGEIVRHKNLAEFPKSEEI
ncbi:MAG: phosphate signaling complex protein PhoU [Pseudomonadota bacterium]|nr:phosphate signaling complex protein PhoU [Pseudomonadota bacterium]